MASPERSGEGNNTDPNIDTVALFLAGRIKKEDLSENNQFVLDYSLGLMLDDPKFAERINKRKNQLLERGIKRPLYSKEDLNNAKRHRCKRKHTEPGLQPSLWEDPQRETIDGFGPEKVIDPMRRFYEEVGKIEKQRHGFMDTILDQEAEHKRMMLRKEIGLPVARGKDPHVNDEFYKYLVRRVYLYDIFGIFNEYDRNIGELPEQLSEKIDKVKNIIHEVLDPNLGTGTRYRKFNDFVERYNKIP